MTAQRLVQINRRTLWWLFFIVPALSVLLWSGCFHFNVPAQAQIGCSEDNDLCPQGWTCCGDRCEEGHCACEHGACNTEYAVDCQQGRICSGGCWQDCPGCYDDCADRSLKNCSLDKVQGIWFCSKFETCMIREDVHGAQIADCLNPSPSCTGLNASSCACLSSPQAYYPPCGRDEACEDRSTQCVACVQQTPGEPDDSARDLDSGIGSVVADATTDVLGEDAGADGAADGGAVSTLVPDCFRGIATSPGGQTCCDVYPRSAQNIDGRWRCPDDMIFAPQCDGFGQQCMADESPLCDVQNGCLWEISADDGLSSCLQSDAMPAPCLDHQWQCYSGTRLRSDCDSIVDP